MDLYIAIYKASCFMHKGVLRSTDRGACCALMENLAITPSPPFPLCHPPRHYLEAFAPCRHIRTKPCTTALSQRIREGTILTCVGILGRTTHSPIYIYIYIYTEKPRYRKSLVWT